MHEWNRDGRWQDVEDVFRAAAHDTECPELVKEGNNSRKKPVFYDHFQTTPQGCRDVYHCFLLLCVLFFSITFIILNIYSCTENSQHFKLDPKSEKYSNCRFGQSSSIRIGKNQQNVEEFEKKSTSFLNYFKWRRVIKYSSL